MPATLRAGAARLEITPPVGVDLTGFVARENPNIGERDPLYVRALVLDDDDRQVALISCDLLGFDRELAIEIRDRIALATGISAPQVMLACTHTHGGPATIHLVGCGEIDPDYVEMLQPRIVEAVAQAQANLQPATLAVGSTSSSTGVHNRRTPGDVIDPEVGLLRVDDAEGAPIAVVVNYTCHPTTLHHVNRYVTADYPGLVSSRVEKATGAVALFLMGAIGDVGPVARGEESLATVGNAVADAALAALPELVANDVPRLETAGETLALPLLPLPSRNDWLTWRAEHEAAAFAAEHAKDTINAKVHWAQLHWTERMFEAMQDNLLAPTVNGELKIIRMGDLVIVGVPGEFFVELGLQIKEGIQRSGIRHVMICGFANGNVGYIPARRAYPRGGYEVVDAYKYYGYPAALAPEAGEQIVAEAIEMGKEEN
ncbi:MAG: neutral/alkaline non-lysosomal ceramidase N-terminal domain-containing protein [Caldilineaceae bacterium]|nr:neutral/alkaline non-lysosomal ceramidase N-terminal domain-containing protein [Caldilineaceae bacterium]